MVRSEGWKEGGREGGRQNPVDLNTHLTTWPFPAPSLLPSLPPSLPPSLLLRPSTINYPCPRTGLSPLHKAIEVGREGGEGGKEGGATLLLPLLRLLVEHGADRGARASLYDGERGWEMARRFGRGGEVEALLLVEGGKEK